MSALPPAATAPLTTEDVAEDSEVATAEARAGRARAFREDTREARMKIAREAQHRFQRKVSWGLRVGDHEELWTHVAAPVMTRLRQPQRQVLDTLVDAGVARSRSDALAWCVRLVAQHEEDWLAELREAMTANPYLKVFAACGHYDLATPQFALQYTRDHLGLEPERRDNFTGTMRAQ